MIDLLLLVMSVIWGTNYSIIKSAFRELEPQAFNSARMLIASTAFLIVIGFLRLRPVSSRASGTERASKRERSEASSSEGPEGTAAQRRPRAPRTVASIFQTPTRMTSRDWWELAALGFVGHFLYQYVFIGGLALTTVANSSLMLAATPVVIALMTAPLGQERVGPRHWLGAALSMLGIYIVVGRNVRLSGEGLQGDLMMVAAVICWAIYTLGSRRLISRHSPVGVTGLSMAMGTIIYVLVNWTHVRAVDWLALSTRAWLSIVYSAIFALGVAYTIWYAAVQQIGSARTSVYSNVIPIVAMATAVVFLGEPLGWRNIVGAAAVLLGVALTRTAPQAQPAEPCEP